MPSVILVGNLSLHISIEVCLGIPIVIFSLFNFRLVYTFFIISLFIDLLFLRFSAAVLFSFMIYISFLFNYDKIRLDDFKSPFSFPLIIYLISIIPSFINVIKISTSIYLLYNLFAIIATVYISVATIKNLKEIKNYILVFMSMVFLNSLHVIYQGMTEKIRAFGFAGIMFVDYVGIAIIILFLAIIYKAKYSKFIVPVLLAVIILASFLTQTRNPWITIFLTTMLILIYSIRYSARINIKKKNLIAFLIFLIILIPSTFLIIKNINPVIAQRTETKNFGQTFDNYGRVESSLVSRVLIWDTAINAFEQHPIAGIGVYSFPISSYQYYEIPKFLFDTYVKGLTPHVAYLAVLTETGIIGFSGFLFLLFSVIRISFQTLKLAVTNEELLITNMLVWSTIYIYFSMFMSDAWLWGQGGMLWGILMGLLFADRKILLKKYSNH